MSYINNVKNFILSDGYATIVDYPIANLVKTNLIYLSIWCNRYMNLEGYSNLNLLQLTFNDQFQTGSITTNYATTPKCYISITHNSNILLSFYLDVNSQLEHITYDGLMSPPASVLVLPNYYDTLSLSGVGNDFHINHEIPISVPNAQGEFAFNGGNIISPPAGVPNSFLTLYTFQNNQMTTLPTLSGRAYSFDVSNNEIDGTIDESWCGTYLNVANNNLHGVIPSCFTCYFKSDYSFGIMPTMYARFAGNSFDNYDLNIKCKTFAPKVSIIDDGLFNSILITGKDIGLRGEVEKWKINGTIEIDSPKRNDNGISFTSMIKSGNFKHVEYFSLSFVDPFSALYTFPIAKKGPIVKSITIASQTNLHIEGLYFSSYAGYVVESIMVENESCLIMESSFTQISCEIGGILVGNTIKYFEITTDGKAKKVYFNSSDSQVNQKECNNDCSGKGDCDLYSGACSCYDGFTGNDCSHFQCGDPNCGGNGVCNPFGLCVCEDKKWLGMNCTIPYHYITSITASTTKGGNVIVYGSFGIVHTGLSIIIDDVGCSNETIISPNEIHCNALAGNGIKELVVTQNGASSKLKYQYTEIIQACPSNCSGHGACNPVNGECTCFIGYSLHDCSVSSVIGGNDGGVKPPTNASVDPNTGGTNFVNQEINFQIYFKSLSEIDINGNPIEIHLLQDKWVLNSTNQQNKHTFKQTIQTDNTCSIISTIEEVKDEQGKQFEFAGTTFKLDQGSIKFTISISNYTFKNNLNTLKLDLISTVGQNEENECNSKDPEINTHDLSTFNYIKISKNNKILSGRFINKVVSDGKSTFLSTTISKEQESIIVSLNLPHCYECYLDPDFSVLVSSDFKSECDSPSRKWIIPVAVVVSVVGAASIATALFFILKKSTTMKVQLHKLKRLNK